MVWRLAPSLALACAACAATDAVTISHAPPPPACRLIGPVQASDTRPGSSATYANAAEQLKVIAVERGGDFVVVEEERSPTSESRAFPPSYRVAGRLYRCHR
jgi:hypothetical protein